MIEIIFEAHGTTFDNEAHLSSGHNDVELSPLGIQQSKEMGIRYKDDHFDAIFCSDLQRAYKSAEIGFGDKWPIVKDARLRECNYGDLTQHPSAEVDVEKPKRINEPFPNGESYEQTTARMNDFLNFLQENYDGKRVMIIGHRATQYGLDNLINGVSLEQLTSSHFKWQPGWKYEFNGEGKELKIVKKFRNPTKEADDLKKALEDKGVRVLVELHDGHKHIDLAIPKAKINVEVDGIQHLTNPQQILADLNRGYYSHQNGYNTMHIPNEMIRSHLKEISEALAEASKIREKKLSVHVD